MSAVSTPRATGYDVLSVDEQQLVGVARLLLAAPRFAVLAPAALGTEQAAHVLATLAEHGIGYVVLGDSGLDRDCFDAIVEIAADGTWTHTVTTEVRQ